MYSVFFVYFNSWDRPPFRASVTPVKEEKKRFGPGWSIARTEVMNHDPLSQRLFTFRHHPQGSRPNPDDTTGQYLAATGEDRYKIRSILW
ncbi:hypothetical protein PISMIDRAFT_177023 [Pisolithus microcarpus 441]|uniref:Unplaced genomic scaffold scaffold_113, whole genome shotgun sequence n=1 Tax=Pisolithus microcarpus 441 TaxID=765257 RepID=A0A0C9ZFJ0_9AGAM|nr:hypothetical protein PISMIDRAFT_177023 [Pisolithus microcarpus 441]